MKRKKQKNNRMTDLEYLERKYGKEPPLTEEELKTPRWH